MAQRFRGIDVSHWQGDIRWADVAADGISFAIVKATDGLLTHGHQWVDPFFAANWKGAQDAGIFTGAFHFARHSGPSPKEQAEHFLDTVGPLGPRRLPLALDLEEPPKDKHGHRTTWHQAGVDPTEFALEFLPIVDQATGLKSVVYTGPDFISAYGIDARLTAWPLWLAQWTTGALTPQPWAAPLWWQYSDQGAVAGIDGVLDVDQSEFDPATLTHPGARTTNDMETPDVPLSDDDISKIAAAVTPAVAAAVAEIIKDEVVSRLHLALGEHGELERATDRIIAAIQQLDH